MSKPKIDVIKLSVAVLIGVLIGGVSLLGNSAAAPQDFPAGKGAELARAKCVTCHEADLIVSQRLSRLGWTREVEKMMRWGTALTEAEKETLIDYFAAHFPPHATRVAAMTSEARGKQIFDAKCLTCHEADLTEQQRLSRLGWTREVEKMRRWGAPVTDAEKEPLVDYLVQSFGPRPLTTRK
jgi:mono/diheme cytochrome c family protein